MENLLQGIPQVIVRMDDILISGKDDNDHMAKLEAVLKKLSTAGLRLRREKCFFMVPEVTYSGYVINGRGIKPVAAKVEAIQNAPAPGNVTQLRAFLGMLNYHRFLPDIATVLQPLHKLEALAIIFGVKKFNQFLYRHKFTIQTNDKPLEGLFNEEKGVPHQAAPSVQRWALTLVAYEYKTAYKVGKADALSRLPLSEMPESVPIAGETVLLLEHLEQTPVNAWHIREWRRLDRVLSRVYQFTLRGWPT
ncbi:Retrovirus-related Pol polyprotein from transposon 17.6 [Stylophora pistillata]|uniref:Retrovirus-related Pol polyprotein from transposon 17.6 n=1 Tax=Stylophora pistillata TaxID=50429 RepID=A0A2B4R1M3_STYPI|nr:Retrovirus-related Pol polyprotein from transposon 17.6 [Stylophora pistillata]